MAEIPLWLKMFLESCSKEVKVSEEKCCVPEEPNLVKEYALPKGCYAEQGQSVEDILDAAEAARVLLLNKLKRERRELDRVIEDLEDRQCK